MEITEKGFYADLGVTPPATGAEVQNVADSEKATGAEVQEVADPETVIKESQTNGDGTETQTGYVDDEIEEAVEHPKGEKPQQTLEERRANAARRRQAETQAAVENALAEERKKHSQEMSGIIKTLGLVDPDSGQAVENLDQLRDFQRKQKNADLQKKFQNGTVTHEDIASIVTDAIEKQHQQQPSQPVQPSQQTQDQLQEAARQRINDEMRQIMEMDGSIKNVGDLLTMTGAKEFREKVARGYSILDAFKLVRGPELERARVEAAKQAAANNLRGKSHLRGTGTPHGDGAISVPRDEMAMYRAFNPGATDADFQAHYNQNRK